MPNPIQKVTVSNDLGEELEVGEAQRVNDGEISLRLNMDVLHDLINSRPDAELYAYASIKGEV